VHFFKRSILIFERYGAETAFDTSAFMEIGFGGNEGPEVYTMQELHNCSVMKYGLILSNV
jgi:hypothetical protein